MLSGFMNLFSRNKDNGKDSGNIDQKDEEAFSKATVSNVKFNRQISSPQRTVRDISEPMQSAKGKVRSMNSQTYKIREALIDFDAPKEDDDMLRSTNKLMKTGINTDVFSFPFSLDSLTFPSRYKRGDQIIQTSVTDENGYAEGALKKYDRSKKEKDPTFKLTGRFRVNFTSEVEEILM